MVDPAFLAGLIVFLQLTTLQTIHPAMKKKIDQSWLTLRNWRWWQKNSFPLSLRSQLASSVPKPLRKGEIIRYEKERSAGKHWVITTTTEAVRIYTWLYPDPSKTQLNKMRWKRGRGFTIPRAACWAWRQGIDKLVSLAPEEFELNDGLYLHEICYGLRLADGDYSKNVRFFVERKSLSDMWFRQVQDFFPANRHYNRGASVLCSRSDDMGLWAGLRDALEFVESQSTTDITPSPGAESIYVEVDARTGYEILGTGQEGNLKLSEDSQKPGPRLDDGSE